MVMYGKASLMQGVVSSNHRSLVNARNFNFFIFTSVLVGSEIRLLGILGLISTSDLLWMAFWFCGHSLSRSGLRQSYG